MMSKQSGAPRMPRRAQPGAWSCALSGPWSAALGLGAREARRSGRWLGRVSTGDGGIRPSRQQGLLPFFQGLLAEIEAERGSAEAALAGIDGALALAGETGEHWFDAGLHRIRGEILVKQNPADPAAAEAAFLAAIAVAQQQKARSFELRAALSLAKLYQSTGRPIDAHDVLGPALAGFSPTPEFPQIAEAKALFEALAEADEVKAAAASRQRLADLHTSYGSALLFDRGHAAPETMSSFERARQLASGAPAIERISSTYGLWIGSFMRGELGPMRELAKAALLDCENRPNAAEAGVAHRMNCATAWFTGDYVEAQSHFERALTIYAPVREGGLDIRFGVGQDGWVAVVAQGSLALWAAGKVDRVRQLLDASISRADAFGHVPTSVLAHSMAALLQMVARNPARARPHAEIYLKLARENDMRLWTSGAEFVESWLSWHLGDRKDCLARIRRGVALWRKQGMTLYDPLTAVMQAEIEADSSEWADALATVDRALAESDQTGQRWFDAELHRARGGILLEQSPADPAAAEAAFLAAIAVAQQQQARSFELRAALSLAKLYESTGRPIDAHDVLGPALAGFSPTPEFPQIAEAKALFEALAADETVIAEAARRGQRLKLQTNYGQAVMWSKGYAAEETKAALARVGELATEIGNAEAQLDAYHARFHYSLLRGELGSARETAESFLRAAEHAARPAEAATAHRLFGTARLVQGDFPQARARFEQTLRIYDAERDREAKFRLGPDSKAAATSYLAHAVWCLGDIGRARELVDEAVARGVESAHAPTLVVTYFDTLGSKSSVTMRKPRDVPRKPLWRSARSTVLRSI